MAATAKEQEAEGGRELERSPAGSSAPQFAKVGRGVPTAPLHSRELSEEPRRGRDTAPYLTEVRHDWTNDADEAICSLHGVVGAYAEVVPSFCRVAVALVSHIHQGATQKNSWS